VKLGVFHVRCRSTGSEKWLEESGEKISQYGFESEGAILINCLLWLSPYDRVFGGANHYYCQYQHLHRDAHNDDHMRYRVLAKPSRR
jgi:hypothetical protein